MTNNSEIINHSEEINKNNNQPSTKIVDEINASIKNNFVDDDKALQASLAAMDEETLMAEFNKESNKATNNRKNIFLIYNEFSKRGISYSTVMTERLKSLGK